MTQIDDLPRIGLGCWPLSGSFYAGTSPLGYANADPAESVRALHAAYDHGIRIFDTAAVYGAGKGERLLQKALSGRDVFIVSKIGLDFDEDTEQLTGMNTDPADVVPAIDRCLNRLGRDHIDLMLLHPNEVTIEQSHPIFDEMEKAREAGKIKTFGWSTDFPDKISAHTHRDGFRAVEHAMHVFFDAKAVRDVTTRAGLAGLVRSPLAMGVLSGKYVGGAQVGVDDVRSASTEYNDYFVDGQVNPNYLARIAAVRELLQIGGRTLTQGALSWCLAVGHNTIPVPGARTVAQVEENAATIGFAPLPDAVVHEIAGLIDQSGGGDIRAR